METLYDKLRQYRDAGVCPMHMPGHKRDTARWQMENPYGLDITEIDGFDNLHDARGVLREAMDRAARLWGAEQTWFLVNGSSCGVLAAVAACTRWGDEVLVARNSHRSLYNALYQNNLRPRYLCPELIPGFGAAGGVTARQVEEALRTHSNVKLVAITSPTYEGVVSDVKGIAITAHRHGVPLLVDEAHGAHLGLAAGFPAGAVRSGADLVVQSVHKTLPSLTQTALLHRCGTLVSAAAVERQLSIYESSSPSYVLMAAIDRCAAFLEENGEQAFALYRENLRRFDEQTASLRALCLLGRGREAEGRPGRHGIHALDPSKLVIGAFGSGLTGPALMERLRREDKIELEMAARTYAIAMTSLCDTRESLDRLASALLRLDASLAPPRALAAAEPALPLPERVLTLREAEERRGRVLPLREAVGRISRETVFAYPPGIPLIVPGERLSAELADHLRLLAASGVALDNTRHGPADTLEVLAES